MMPPTELGIGFSHTLVKFTFSHTNSPESLVTDITEVCLPNNDIVVGYFILPLGCAARVP
jgi:hypothetical protein